MLMKWWQQGDLDPKFKWLLILDVLIVLVAGVSANVYAFEAPPVFPSQECDANTGGQGFYQWRTHSCVTLMYMTSCLKGEPGYCVIFSPGGGFGQCVPNCTVNRPPAPHPPMAGV